MAPNYGVGSIILGGCIAHILTIIIAMILGKIIERFCAERLVNLIGGLLFIGFGFWELFFGILYIDYFEE
jgi:putative Ca2+/H+ antiporter (TMEM165/GDT1 family)